MTTADTSGRVLRTTRKKVTLCEYHNLGGFTPVHVLCMCSPLVMKVRSRASSVMSGASTPGGGKSNSLSEGDLRKADAALSHVQANGVNGAEKY